MTDLKFTADEVDRVVNSEICGETVLGDDGCKDTAICLNRILEEKLKNSIKVMGRLNESGCGQFKTDWGFDERDKIATHAAKLIDIKEIIQLSENDSKQLLETLENPLKPNEKLLEMFKNYRTGSNTQFDHCLTCNSVIIPPNTPVMYSGPICSCPIDPSTIKYQRRASEKKTNE